MCRDTLHIVHVLHAKVDACIFAPVEINVLLQGSTKLASTVCYPRLQAAAQTASQAASQSAMASMASAASGDLYLLICITGSGSCWRFQ